MAAQEDFVDLRQYFVDPIQHDYEVIRPIVLFAETAAERSRQTGVERWWATKLDALSSKAWTASATGGRRRGTAGARLSRRHCRVYPLFKQLYPPIHLREMVRIVHRKFGYKTNHHTLKRFLAL